MSANVRVMTCLDSSLLCGQEHTTTCVVDARWHSDKSNSPDTATQLTGSQHTPH